MYLGLKPIRRMGLDPLMCNSIRLFRAEVTLNQQKSMMEHLLQSGRKGTKVSKMGILLP